MDGEKRTRTCIENMQVNFDGSIKGGGVSPENGPYTIIGTMTDHWECDFIKDYNSEDVPDKHYKANLEKGVMKGTWENVSKNSTSKPQIFKLTINHQNWSGYFMQGPDQISMGLKLMVQNDGVSALGADDVGNYILKGDFDLKQKVIKFSKRYYGQNSHIYYGKVKLMDNRMIIDGIWHVSGQTDRKFRLVGRFGTQEKMMSCFLNDDQDIDYEVQLSETVKYYSEITGKMIYNGEMAEGQMTGWGTMFADDGESKVAVGQFTDGKPDGDFVKVYNAAHVLVFKGMMVNGEKGTMGTIYYEASEKLMYKGELNSSGVPQGFGREFYETGQKKYCGCFVEGKFNGDGELWDDKGRSIFQGAFDGDLNGPWTGHANFYAKIDPEDPASEEFLLYEGELLDGKYHGRGYLHYSNGAVEFFGDFAAGLKSGKGQLYNKESKLIYDGEFFEDRKEGENGILYDHEGSGQVIYCGSWKENKYLSGTLSFANGLPNYKGSFSEQLFDGSGEEFSEAEEKRILRSGPYVAGSLDGPTGCKTYYDETDGPVLYEGGYSNGLYNGEGIIYFKNGMKKFEGHFTNGNIENNEGQYYFETGVLMYKGPIIDESFTGENVTLYTESGSVKYEGPMESNEQHGASGKLYFSETSDNGPILKYEGGFKMGFFHGDDVSMYHETGKIAFKGNYVDGKQNGENCLVYDDQGQVLYEGGMEADMRSGEGKAFNPEDGTILLEGRWSGGALAEGNVTQFGDDGIKTYDGKVKDGGVRHGFGIEFWPNGSSKYMGNWEDNLMHHGENEEAKAVQWFENGRREYTGCFEAGVRSGEGVLFDANAEEEFASYVGQFANGVPHGSGKFYFTKEESTNHVLQCMDDNNDDPTAGLALKYSGPVHEG